MRSLARAATLVLVPAVMLAGCRAGVMGGPYVHDIDPIATTVAGVHVWWYGLAYSLGFLLAHLWLRGGRKRLGLSLAQVYDLSLLLATGVLAGGRVLEVLLYEWPFYRQHPALIPAYWLGGMATHGLLLGGLTGTWLFCRIYRVPLLALTDALAIPGALILGLGRLGNFADGQIVGRVTDVWWAVEFPDAAGFRHPVVLYDGLKNLLLIPLLLLVRRSAAPHGVVTGLFLFFYAFLRIFVDLFRQYPTTLLGLATGQSLNLVVAIAGAGLVAWRGWAARRPSGRDETAGPPAARPAAGLLWPRALALAILIGLASTMPSDWTQDVPARYGKRHPGLEHSALYPPLD